MKKFSVNRIYIAFAVAAICFGSCIVRENPYINAFVILFGFFASLIIAEFAFENPTKGEEKVMNKLNEIF